MKKHILAALLCALLLALGFAALAEDAPGIYYCDRCGSVREHSLRHAAYIDGGQHEALRECSRCGWLTTVREAHYGGTATCTQAAVCAACREEYGSPLNHDVSQTASYLGNGRHGYRCQRDGCDYVENQDACSGGSALCTEDAVCTTCGGTYREALAEHDFVYTSNGNGTHSISCRNLGCTYSASGTCSGGTATCTERAMCDACERAYGDYAPHSFTNRASSQQAGAATCTQAAMYYVQCDNCDAVSDTETVPAGEPLNHDYSGPAATCTTAQICAREGCGAVLAEAKGHDYSGPAATCTTAQICARKGCGAVLAKAKGHDYSGAPATCTTAQICAREGCGAVLEEARGHDYSGAPATCTTAQICAREGCGAVLAEAKGHDYSGPAATCTTAQICAREGCGAVLEEARGHTAVIDAAVEPTCTQDGLTEGSHCAVCALELVPQRRVEALGHTEVRRGAVEPACTEAGRTDGVYCAVCGDTLRAAETVPALGHWYGEWTPNGDDTHSASCRREGCGHTGNAACAAAHIPAPAEDAEDIAFCPVCGAVSTGERLELAEGARIAAVNGDLPRGELVLRVGTLADGRQVMSVAMEHAGALEQPLVEVEISVPAEACALWNPASLTEGGALAEAWSLHLYAQDGSLLETACAAAENALAFHVDFTPVEGEENVPWRLCLLTPETA